jgi:site-specific DNA-methyltransferase (cytosine-N4-specific)
VQLEEKGSTDSALLVGCPGCPECIEHHGYVFHLSAGRPTKAHEYVFLLSKSARYFYDQDAIKVPASADTHARYARGRSDTHKYADGGPGDQTIARTFEHMRAPGVNPKAVAPGLGIKNNESFSAAVKDIVGERNARSVWTIPTQPTPDAHFATFPEALAERCILAGSAGGDTVLDPFFGSGTVGKVAERLGRKWVGIELNPAYVEISERKTSQRGIFA